MTRKHYLLLLLLVIYAFNQVDRLALGLLLQDIKLDLSLSDTQLGLLTGLAFAVFYSVLGIPIARWADRGNRVSIIWITTALWSAAVALCGLAQNFLQLLTMRVGVAVGEAGCVPPAQSLIADHFTRAERPRATSIYLLGGPLSLVIGYFLAGWLNQFYGWRMTFMLLGLPGLVLAALARLTLKEPRRENRLESRESPAQPSLEEVAATLSASVTFRHLLLGFSIQSFFGQGIWQWAPAFFIRSFHLQTGELGVWFACVGGVSGLVGTYWGGRLASRFAPNDERRQLQAIAIAFSLFAILLAGVYLCTHLYLAFLLLSLSGIGGAMTNGPLFATIQSVAPDRMRATAIATMYLFANLIGMGFGPLAAGMLSDFLRPWAGEESLRYTLLILCPGYLWGAWHLWRASRTVTGDIAAST